MDTLQACLHASNQDPAVILPGNPSRTISHSSLAGNVTKVQQTLVSRSIGRGTKVSIVLSNPYIFTVAFLATTLQSSIAAPLNHGFKQPEFEYYYQDFGAELVLLSEDEVASQGPAYTAAKKAALRIATCAVTDQEVTIKFLDDKKAETAGQPNYPNPEDCALVLHTSGTTGKPKAVPLNHANIARSISNIAAHYSLTATDRTPVIMPLFHIHGLVAALCTPLATGGAVIFPRDGKSGITPSFLRNGVEHQATWYTATPTLHRLAAQIPMKETPKFRFVRSCSSRLEGALARELGKRYGCPVVEAYAMTEAAHQVCSNPVSESGTREGSVGLPTGIELRILDDDGNEMSKGEVGEVGIKGVNVMKGYLGNDDANAKSFTASGFFRTGDQGKMTEGGYVVLTGRIKELINKGGEKISPVEVDNVMNQHPDVAEAVAFSMPDDMYGEDIGVAVITKEGTNVSQQDLKAWVGERLLQTKVPKKIFFVDAIPKTAVGKMQRGLVAKTVLEK